MGNTAEIKETKTVNWTFIIGIAIFCATLIVIGVMAYQYNYDKLSLTTERGSAEDSPIIAVLNSTFTLLGALVSAVIVAAIPLYKIMKKLNTVEKQTNGRLHTRDHALDTLTSGVKSLMGVITKFEAKMDSFDSRLAGVEKNTEHPIIVVTNETGDAPVIASNSEVDSAQLQLDTVEMLRQQIKDLEEKGKK